MNYKYLKLLFTNLVNLEEKIRQIKHNISIQSEEASIIVDYQNKINQFEMIVLEYENLIKAYVENHK